MSGKCFGSDAANEAIEAASASSLVQCGSAVCPKLFLITYGDPGLATHNLGDLPRLAAVTHEREVKNNAFPGVPRFTSGKDVVRVIHTTDAIAFVRAINETSMTIGYLSYFGHSWATDGGSGLLLIGEEDAAGTNLGSRGAVHPNDVPVAHLMRSSFYNDAQIRLFGCRGAYGNTSAAKQISDHLGIETYGYASGGGSLFTNDKTLGHGGRRTRQADIDAKVSSSKDIWLVPANGAINFTRF